MSDASSDPNAVEREPDRRVSSIPLTTEDGEEVIIEQQNVGPRNQVGGGEFKPSDETADRKDPGRAAEEQEQLEREAPIEGIEGAGDRNEGPR